MVLKKNILVNLVSFFIEPEGNFEKKDKMSYAISLHATVIIVVRLSSLYTYP